ncbi:MAG: hypothetical protein QME61_01400, partial [Patescibacteria group bacterium]|nr:hypothetical protein [Patescibacteria group bacterium]
SKMTFIGEGLEVETAGAGDSLPVYATGEGLGERGKGTYGYSYFQRYCPLTCEKPAKLSILDSTHQNYIKSVIFDWRDTAYGGSCGDKLKISLEGQNIVDTNFNRTVSCDECPYYDRCPEEGSYSIDEPSYFWNYCYGGEMKVNPNYLSDGELNNIDFNDSCLSAYISLEYILSVPSRNPSVEVNDQTISSGELKDGVKSTAQSITLNQGVNTLNFSTVGPGSVLESPHQITSSVGSGKFNYIITGDLAQSIDLASEINKYLHENCPDAICTVPITFSGIGSKISLTAPAVSYLSAEEPICSPFNSSPTATSLSFKLGCIWPLVELRFTYQDPDGDPMATISSFKLQIAEDENFENIIFPEGGGELIISTGETKISSGSGTAYLVGKLLPVKKLYYWRVKVQDSKGAWSDWASSNFDLNPM